jgi:osmotically-inducible protein OsmY
MNSRLAATLVIGALFLPVAGYAADSKSVTESVKENVGDAVITTKIKAAFAKDKQVSAMNIKVDTDDKGVVTLSGNAKSRAEADKAGRIARDTKGVSSVRNDIQITPAKTAAAGDQQPAKNRAAEKRRSDHPIDDSVITTKIKGKFIKDKQVRADNIEIKTVNGDVELFGTARSKAKAARAVVLARQVKGVKSVKNNIEITPPETAAAGDKKPGKDRTAEKRRSDQPVDDTWITTKVKAKFVEDKQVSATTIHVKTVNGVVELTGTAKSMDEATKAASLARGVEHVKSVTNNIKVN